MDPQVTRSRQRILECAVALLRDRGPAPELTVAAAKAANVPLSVAQQFFPNDEELILALLLLWSQDRSADSKSTHAALNLFTKLLSQIRRARWLPGSGGLFDSIGDICGPLVDPPANAAHTAKAEEILRLVFRHRRLLP